MIDLPVPESRNEEPAYVKARAEVIIQKLNDRGHIPSTWLDTEALYYREKVADGIMPWHYEYMTFDPTPEPEGECSKLSEPRSSSKEPDRKVVTNTSEPLQTINKTPPTSRQNKLFNPPPRYNLRSEQTRIKESAGGRVTKRRRKEGIRKHAMVTRSRCNSTSLHK